VEVGLARAVITATLVARGSLARRLVIETKAITLTTVMSNATPPMAAIYIRGSERKRFNAPSSSGMSRRSEKSGELLLDITIKGILQINRIA
jgi:hypothetical protein